MAGTHEGVFEDGVLATCGICGVRTHMLDPEEMDWICDPCSTAGWTGFTSAYKLRAGNVISLKGESYVVLSTDQVGKWTELEYRPVNGEAKYFRFFRATRKVYIHGQGVPIA